jgi:precorrin-6Y C5,15-methyltransferase (decarboxylating)
MSTHLPRVSIIGIGSDGLDAVAAKVRQRILNADLVAGDSRTLALVPDSKGERFVLGSNLDELLDYFDKKSWPDQMPGKATEADVGTLEGSNGEVVVLVTGDPLFYGLARYLCDRLGDDHCEIVPHVSSMQLAFARVKESWDEAYLTDLANRSLGMVVERIRTAEKVGIFTTSQCSPADVAVALLARKIDYFNAYVCENLGARDERVTRGSLQEIAQQSFESLNVMILIRMANAPDRPPELVGRSLFGNPDELFAQSKPKQGLLTPSEVRAVALSQLRLGASSIVWDVGAGCGSVSVEAAQLAPSGQVYAIERDVEDQQLIRLNADRFGVTNVTPVLGAAPEAWHDLPDPDGVFIEGSGKEIARIADLAFVRLRAGGRLVANVVSIEGLHEVRQSVAQHTNQVQVRMFNIARGTDQLGRIRFDSLNPTFLISATKE